MASPSSPSQLRAAAGKFSIAPKVGDQTGNRTGATVSRVIGELVTNVILLDDGASHLCLVAAPMGVESSELRRAIQQAVGEETGLKPEQVVGFSSHNHCVIPLADNQSIQWQHRPEKPLGELNASGRDFIAGLRRVVRDLPGRLEPVGVEWGSAREERFTYNRRGKRPDGRPYFIREEDRVLLGEGYRGLIDPDATLVVFRGTHGRAVAALVHYTGHPVTAFRPEKPIVFGEWPQLACEAVAEKIGAPVAFLQGCAGDINSKFLLTGTPEQSHEFGVQLAETLLKALGSLQPSKRTDLHFRHQAVGIPLADLPDLASLERDLGEIDAFIRRGQSGDEDTLFCVGMNFPKILTPPYRAKLVEMIRPWFVQAIETHRSGRLDRVPKTLPIEFFVGRIGDVGLVGMPFEPFVRIGLRIKKESPLPCVLPCGYCEGSYGYITDASSCDEREYTAGFFRYTPDRPPLRAPAGEAVAIAAVQALRELA